MSTEAVERAGAPATSLLVNEIFFSIQGESTYQGRPCLFVRLTGCPLRCRWCDTEYAFHEGKRRSIDEVVRSVHDSGARLVEITGGEPLVQRGVHPLMERLLDEGFTVLLETSGAFTLADVDPRVIKIMDLKCPASREEARNDWSNLQYLDEKDQIKFVVADRGDYDWSVRVMREHRLDEKMVVLMSPVHGELEPRILGEWILADRLPVRLQVQLHKYLWGADARGV